VALDWKLVFARRGMRLEYYVAGINTVDEVIAKFANEGMEPPSREEILNALRISSTPEFDTQRKVADEGTPEDTEVSNEAESDERLVESPRQLDSLVIL